MIKKAGYWFPDSIEHKYRYFINHMNDGMAVIKHLGKRDRGNVIQAGGHVGLWPLSLSKIFSGVYTFEPDPENYECLVKNTRGIRSIHSFECGLSSITRARILARSPVNTGGHYLKGPDHDDQDSNAVQVNVMRIDDIGLSQCTGIFLDIEGHEIEALMGAEETIKRTSPILMLEVKDHIKKGGCSAEELHRYLSELNYRKVGEKAHDSIYIKA